MHGKDEKMTVVSAEDMDMVCEHGSSADRNTFTVTDSQIVCLIFITQ